MRAIWVDSQAVLWVIIDDLIKLRNLQFFFSSSVFGLNRGTKTARLIRETRPVRVYHATGKFGKATETHFNDSPITALATFDHIYEDKLNSCLSSIQTSHQKKMFELCGVDLQSQTAFELAAKGPLRPIKENVPLIYSMRCIEFKKPYFTIGTACGF